MTADAKDAAICDDEKGADFRCDYRGGNWIGVADCPIVRRAVVAR
jgi:hypothetical protein